MKRASFLIFTIAIVASFVCLMGCSSVEDPGDGGISSDELATRAQSENLNDPYGGFNTKDERPAFGDPELAAEFDVEDVAYNDPFATDREVNDLEASQRERTMLMITWGNLSRDEGIDQRTDWNGSLTVDPGVVLLKRVIRFEPNDQILPRTRRDLLEWESTTSCCHDGILVQILAEPQVVDPVRDDGIDSSMTTIAFEAGPVTVEFTLDQLPNLNRTITLDDGNAVSLQAIKVAPDDCPNGFARGEWSNHPERRGGVFFGKWETESGRVMGLMRGHYGVNDRGEQVFFGKMISRDGRFEGLIVGRWEQRGDEKSGAFEGDILSRNRDRRGRIRGEWKRSDRCDGGFFRARWTHRCNVDS